MLNYLEWLKRTDVVRVLIAQVSVYSGGANTTRYISTHPVTVGGVSYLPVIKNSVQISSSINLEYSASISFGDIELANNGGALDSWLNDVWVNKSCKIYYGSLPTSITDQSLANDYELIFDGVVEDIDSKSFTVLNLKIRDKLEKLNYPVTEALLGNYFHGEVLADDSTAYTNQSRNNLRPLTLGEVHNITPLLTDPTQLEYMVNDGAVEQIVEVLDNGVPVSFRTVKTAAEIGAIPPGSFRLNSAPSGTVTASVQGIAKTINIASSTYVDTYTNKAANIIAILLKLKGRPLEYSEMDATSFSAVAQEPIGLYINSRTNTLAVCQQIAKSCGCVLSVTRTGKVKLIKLQMPASATYTISDSNVLLNSAKISQKPSVLAGIRLGYAKNWTVLTGLVTGIPEEHKNLFAQEYLETKVQNTTSQSLYSVTTEPELEGTLLIDETSANSIANTQLTLRSTQRKILSVQCTAELLHLEVGNAVYVNLNRFGIATGSVGLIMSTNPNWLSGKIDLEVLV